MRAEPNPTPFFGDAIGPWHDHFAWLPIRTYDQRLVWLKWCRRREVMKLYLFEGVGTGTEIWFQYHIEPIGARA
ncbi:hypothetical protein NKJ71_19635 [Mesorhizobium sp. M0050]|uniref:hypothetical protein n=1 Tax=Mesorhizobium sp. M0050 TaxID=2956861 RepID=UPI00333A6E12